MIVCTYGCRVFVDRLDLRAEKGDLRPSPSYLSNVVRSELQEAFPLVAHTALYSRSMKHTLVLSLFFSYSLGLKGVRPGSQGSLPVPPSAKSRLRLKTYIMIGAANGELVAKRRIWSGPIAI